MRIVNQVQEKKVFRRIDVDVTRKKVKICTSLKKSEDEPASSTRFNGKYKQLIFCQTQPLTMPALYASFIEGRNDEALDIFSLGQCMKIYSGESSSGVDYVSVGGESFVRIISRDEQRIYDSTGNLIATATGDESIRVVFSGTGPCLQRTDEKSGTKRCYTFEGSLIG